MRALVSCFIVWGLGWFGIPLAGQSQTTLRVDFNDRSNDLPSHTEEGFDSFVLGAIGGSTATQNGTNTLRFGTVTLSVWNELGTGLNDQRRTVVVNVPGFTNAQVLEDFVYNPGATATNSGLALRIQGLTPNQISQLIIWSFDSNSSGNRVSDWYANGVLVKANYSFNGAVLPTSNGDYHFGFSATADANGEILIRGLCNSTSLDNNNAAAPGVFLNALEITPVPDQRPPCQTLTHFKPGSNLYGWTGGYTFDEQDREVAMLKAAGVQWARINVVWYAVEPDQKGVYDQSLLALYDHLMSKLAENGIKTILVTADTPYWASGDPAKTPGNWNQKYKPAHFSDLADYYVFLLNRYRTNGPGVFEIWNEEDAAFFWPSGVSAIDYAGMLQTCYVAIKTADPLAIVLNGGVTDTSGTTNYINSLYAAGARNYFDAWSQHAYPRAPQYETIAAKVRNLMVANGDSAKKIWFTEFGWVTYTNAADSSAVSYNRQAHYLTDLFTRLASYSYVEAGVWYTSRSYDETVHEGSFGLMLPDFTPKPSYYAYQNWITCAALSCPPPQIVLATPFRLSNGVMRIGFSGPPDFSYSLQASTNLINWSRLGTNFTGTNGRYSYDDYDGTNLAFRFYRITSP
jgi:hypothetical protein